MGQVASGVRRLEISVPFPIPTGEGNGNPLQYPCLENPIGQRSLVCYSPWGCKELDTTERLHFPFPIPTHVLSPQRREGLENEFNHQSTMPM